MAAVIIDTEDEIEWFDGLGPARVIGPCPHVTCHHRNRPIAWGLTVERYELAECYRGENGQPSECDGRCRAWRNGDREITTEWLMVDVPRASDR